jgi:hypothetical protein
MRLCGHAASLSLRPYDIVAAVSERHQRTILWAVRIALVLALAFSVAFPDLPQFEGKGMAFRAPFFLLPMAAVPIGWRLRGRHEPYPFLADALVISPFLVDTLGNALNFYNSFAVTDDVLHFVNWVLLVAGITLMLLRTYLGGLAAWALGYGIGALAIIWWEAAEWLVQELGTAGLELTYGDTIGDLVLSSTGGAIGASLAVWFSRPARRDPRFSAQ